MEKRCGEVADCKDSSDQNFCNIVGYNGKSYQKQIPPKESDDKRTPVEVNYNFEFIKNVDELNMKFSSRVVITIIWRDARLVYRNLGDHNILDGKDINAIWKPPLILSNSLDLASIIGDAV